jgi:hypothetical protein
MTTKVNAYGVSSGKEISAEWNSDFGFVPTGEKTFDLMVLQKSLEGVAVGGTYYPERDTAEMAVAVFCEVFDTAPRIEANVPIKEIPYEAGEDAVY